MKYIIVATLLALTAGCNQNKSIPQNKFMPEVRDNTYIYKIDSLIYSTNLPDDSALAKIDHPNMKKFSDGIWYDSTYYDPQTRIRKIDTSFETTWELKK